MDEVESYYSLNHHARVVLGNGIKLFELTYDDVPTYMDKLCTWSNIDFNFEEEEVEPLVFQEAGSDSDMDE